MAIAEQTIAEIQAQVFGDRRFAIMDHEIKSIAKQCTEMGYAAAIEITILFMQNNPNLANHELQIAIREHLQLQEVNHD